MTGKGAADSVAFFVPGTPVPQGSKTIGRRGGKTWLRDANATALKPWRHTVATHADIGVEFDAPVVVTLEFHMPRPLRPRWSIPAVKPDLDKLARATLDGLVDGGLIADDSRVVDLTLTKRYASPERPAGVRVTVTAW